MVPISAELFLPIQWPLLQLVRRREFHAAHDLLDRWQRDGDVRMQAHALRLQCYLLLEEHGVLPVISGLMQQARELASHCDVATQAIILTDSIGFSHGTGELAVGEESFRSYQQLLAEWPDHPILLRGRVFAWSGAGWIAFLRQDWQAALHWFDETRHFGTGDMIGRACQMAAWSLIQLGDLEQAESRLEEASRLIPTGHALDGFNSYLAAELALRRQDYSRTFVLLRKALRDERIPDTGVLTCMGFARGHASLGQWDEAEQWREEALDRLPAYPKYYLKQLASYIAI